MVRVWATPVIVLPLAVLLTKRMLAARSHTVLTPAGVHLLGPKIDKIFAWDSITATPRPVLDIKKDIGQSILLASAEQPQEWCIAGGLCYTMWPYMVIIEHFHDHPEDRHILATPEAIPLLDQLADYPVADNAPRTPKWFKPPPASWANRTW